ncbi:MAG: tetratricopeptide repeat protein, partial [Cyclobacteriaceae bacterium]|nr:tetratricopeptide repeat protein [Cyclobacteriaceae bacterium]
MVNHIFIFAFMGRYVVKFIAFGGFFLMLSCVNKEEKSVEILRRGNDAFRSRDYKRAEGFYEEALSIDSCFSDAYNNLGILSFEKGEFNEAESYYFKSLLCNKDFLPAYFNRFNLFYETHQYYRALDELGVVSKVAGDSSLIDINY